MKYTNIIESLHFNEKPINHNSIILLENIRPKNNYPGYHRS